MIAVILAAGEAKRYGTCKQIDLLDGRPMITHVVEALLKLKLDIYVVTGAYKEQVESVLAGYNDIQFINNINYKNGMSSSIKTGAQVAIDQDTDMLMTLSDLPFVTSESNTKLYEHFRNETIFSSFEDTIGPPVIFARNDLNKLMKLSRDQGAKLYFKNAASIRIEEAAIDIDFKN